MHCRAACQWIPGSVALREHAATGVPPKEASRLCPCAARMCRAGSSRIGALPGATHYVDPHAEAELAAAGLPDI